MRYLHLFFFYSILRLTNVFRQFKVVHIVSLFVPIYLGIFIYFLSSYFITDYTIWATLILAPYIIKPNATKTGTIKYFWWSLIFAGLTYLSGVQTFYFLTIGFAILLIIESLMGDIGYLPLFLLSLLSPTFKYFNNMLGFPVRLKLSEWAGSLLHSIIGYKIEILGNVIIMNGCEFSVDPACVGLKMMAISILAGLLIIAFFQRQTGKNINLIKITLLILLIISLNILSNLIRIVLLVLFELLPGNPLHDIMGVLCLLLYVIIPLYFIIQWIFKTTNSKNATLISTTSNYKNVLLLNTLLLFIVIITGTLKLNHNNNSTEISPNITFAGYTKEKTSNDVYKLQKSGFLLYIKPLSRFYGAEHNPMICWIGSGYTFSRINKRIIEGKEIYTGILQKGTDLIYSAWWFDNGSYQTIKQTDWRWRALKGEQFYLININSENEKLLYTEIARLFKK